MVVAWENWLDSPIARLQKWLCTAIFDEEAKAPPNRHNILIQWRWHNSVQWYANIGGGGSLRYGNDFDNREEVIYALEEVIL